MQPAQRPTGSGVLVAAPFRPTSPCRMQGPPQPQPEARRSKYQRGNKAMVVARALSAAHCLTETVGEGSMPEPFEAHPDVPEVAQHLVTQFAARHVAIRVNDRRFVGGAAPHGRLSMLRNPADKLPLNTLFCCHQSLEPAPASTRRTC